MTWKEATYKVSGDRMLQHNIRLSDPLDEFSKAIKKVSSKRTKTDDDHEEMSRLEFMGGAYYDEKIGYYIPSSTWHSALIEAAKRQKLGKAFKSAVLVPEDTPFACDGPKNPESRWESGCYDRRSVRVGQARVMRTRPLFKEWSTTVTVYFDPLQIERDHLDDAIRILGDQIGLGDYRPIFGRFTVEVVS